MLPPRPIRTAVIGLLAAVAGGAAFAAPPASAYDAYPCVNYQQRTLVSGSSSETVMLMKCPLTQGHVPVRQSRSPSAPIVGYLEVGGSANWFVYEQAGFRETRGSASNIYWASTLADNGRWGWVNETYFRGGANDEDDRGLLRPGSRVGSCNPGSFCPTPPPGPWVR